MYSTFLSSKLSFRYSLGAFFVACLAAVVLPRRIACAAEASFHVGVSKVDITPAYPIRLNGFGFRRDESEGVAQRIWAKALAIRAGNEPPAILLAIDSLGVRLAMVDQVASRLNQRFGIPRERMALTFSHSHCTPKVNGACDNIFSQPIPPEHQPHIDQYSRELAGWLEEAAALAINDLKPAELAWGVGRVGFAKNRRIAGGPVDHDLPVLVVRDPGGKPRAVYFSYACHCVTLSFNRISGDWSGHAQELIERQFPGAVSLASIGCGSDSNPLSGVTGDKVDVAMAQGHEIATEVARLLAEGNTLRPVDGPFAARLTLIDLPLQAPPTRGQLQEMAAGQGPAAYNARTQLARLDRGEKLMESIRYPVQSFTFGDSLHMVFLAGEVCVDYSLRIKRELRHDRIWTNGYANDFCAYIPSERLLKEGGYGGGGEFPYFALPATFQPGLEQKIVDEVKRQAPAAFLVEPGTQGVPAKSPEESRRCLRTHDGLRIELVASEPLIASPVAIDFAPDGKLWVVEMTDYARGVNDEFPPRGRVRVLADRDGDGRYDDATEFLDGLRFPTDVKLWRDGALVCDAPDILFAADTDGDGRADIRKVLFTGFATHNPHARVNSLRYGLDNWVHGSGGLFGGRITSYHGQTVDLSSRDFRMQPDTGVIEPVTGHTQQGRPRDDWDNWFGCTNSTLLMHHVLVDHYARRNPHVAPPPASRYVPDYPESQRLFPSGDLVLFQLSGPPGRPTSACGAEIYRDDWLGSEYAGNAFVCEPVNQLVHRLQLTPSGVTFSGRRAASETDTEFLTSTDRWFRPVQVRTGPDGGLWIVDMYRYLIEHPQWIAPETIAELNVLAGQDRGRIYRIVPKEQGGRPPCRLEMKDNAQLASAFDHANGVQRDMAHELLMWRGRTANAATDATAELERIAHKSSIAAARVQALAALDGLRQLDETIVVRALSDPHPQVRRHAARLAERLAERSSPVRQSLLKRVDDAEPVVRQQVAFAMGAFEADESARALVTLAANAGDDPYLQAAVASSVEVRNIRQILALMADRGELRYGDMAETFLTLAAAIGDEKTVATAIGLVVQELPAEAEMRQWSMLARVLDAADRRRLTLAEGLLEPTRKKIAAVVAAARRIAFMADAPSEQRVAALGLLGRGTGTATRSVLGETSDEDLASLSTLLSPNQPLPVQSAAIQGISRRAGAAAPQWLLAEWESRTIRMRGEILDSLLANAPGCEAVLDALEKNKVSLRDLDAPRRQRLLGVEPAALRARAEKLLAAHTVTDRQKLVEEWKDVPALAGDPRRGQEVYRLRCAACHQLNGVGTNVGPDIAALTNKSPATLLVAILDPNRDVDGRYVSYTALLADGRALTGLLADESGTSVTLREQGGKDHVILRKDIEELRATGKSVMPEGLERDMSRQEVADVIAYVLASRPAPKRFAGNEPSVIRPDPRGALDLPASKAEIYGGEIAFESESAFHNIGYWHGNDDYVAWRIYLDRPGRYDVNVDYSCAPESAGHGLRFEGAEPTLRGVVTSTGAWNAYRLMRLGRVELPAGPGYLTLRFDGAKKGPALMDLRGVHLALAAPPRATVTAAETQGDPRDDDPDQIARMLLDDTRPAEERQKLAAENRAAADAVISAMARDLTPGTPEEYRRIPWIWRVAIAAGKRNDTAEIRSILDASIPAFGQPLGDWQAVVIGGGIINGISLVGDWPKPRIEQAMKGDGVLIARWQRTVELASAMADDEKVPTGTRYDALRMIAMASWDQRGGQLVRYLAAGTHDELQMGAVSGLADIPSPQATEVLLGGLGHLAGQNRYLALEALVRSPERCAALLDAIERGKVKPSLLDEAHRKKLLDHPSEPVRQRAAKVLVAR